MAIKKPANWTRELLRPARRGLSSILRALPVSSAILGPPKGILEQSGPWLETHKTSGTEAWEVTPSLEVRRKPPTMLQTEVYEGFRPFLNQKHPSSRVARIEGARLLHLCVITPDDYILKDLSLHKDAKQDDFKWITSAVRLPRPVRVGGNLTVIGEGFASSYYHWLFHALGRLSYVKERFSLDQISYFAVSHLDRDFHRDSLDMMKVPKEKILLLKDFPHIAPDAVVVSNWTGHFDPTIAENLRKTFLPQVKSGNGRQRRLYVSRGRCPSRHIYNEKELLEVIEPLGFERVYTEDLSFPEQIQLFQGAEAILGPHGAGLSNLVFCRSNTKVIEIFSQSWRNELFWQLSSAVHLDYFCLFGDKPANDKPLHPGPQHENIQVDVAKVGKLLRLAGLG